jgi:hypothetical protein
MILIPKIGNVLAIKGSTAQCMAQPTEVAIPKKSQFAFIAILKNCSAKIINLQQ